jgi:hypothetical protein
MPISNRKETCALKVAAIGRYPASANAMLAYLPDSVATGLPAHALAELLDAMWALAREAKRLAIQDAIADGCVWDARRNAFRDIAQQATQ